MKVINKISIIYILVFTLISPFSKAVTHILPITDSLRNSSPLSSSIDPNPALKQITPVQINAPCVPILIKILSNSPTTCGMKNGAVTSSATGGTGPLNYNWIQAVSGKTFSGKNLTGLADGIYTLTVTDSLGCNDSRPISISQSSGLNISANTTDSLITVGDSVILSSSGGNNYQWTPTTGLSCPTCATTTAKPLTTTTYTVIASNGSGCKDTATLKIEVKNAPCVPIVISVLSNNGTTCGKKNGAVTTTATGGTGLLNYTWDNGVLGKNLSGLDSGSYTLTVSDNYGCKKSQAVTISKGSGGIKTTAITTASLIMQGDSVTLSSSGGNNYQWSPTTGLSCPTCATTTAKPLTTTTYTIIASNDIGCKDTATLKIEVKPICDGSFNIGAKTTDSLIMLGESVTLSSNGGNYHQWTPTTGLSCPTCPVTKAEPITTTTYTVIATNTLGCKDTASLKIEVKEGCDESSLFVANVFSPNGDGKNDQLYIQGSDLSNINWSIFNRWGNKVFESFDQQIGWDGFQDGKLLDTGAYVYSLSATCITSGKKIKMKGTVNIIK